LGQAQELMIAEGFVAAALDEICNAAELTKDYLD
jgi:hypothetical protein